MTLRVTDVPADVEDARLSVHVVEHGQREGGVIPRRFLTVAVPPHRLVQHLETIRSAAKELVEHRVAGRKLALATDASGAETQQADDVGAIGVEVLTFTGSVEADLGSGALDALVADV